MSTFNNPGRAWSCVHWSDQVIKTSTQVIGALAPIIASVLVYASQRNTQTHQGVAQRSIGNATAAAATRDTTAFDRMVRELFGSPNAFGIFNNVTHIDPFAGTLVGTLGNALVEIHEYAENVTTVITPQNAGLLPIIDGVLSKRDENDQMTAAKVIYHNALMYSNPEIRDFSDDERQNWGYALAGLFEYECQNNGRAMCDCLTFGYGNTWVAALTIESQANNNGFFQQMDCDCDIGHDEL